MPLVSALRRHQGPRRAPKLAAARSPFIATPCGAPCAAPRPLLCVACDVASTASPSCSSSNSACEGPPIRLVFDEKEGATRDLAGGRSLGDISRFKCHLPRLSPSPSPYFSLSAPLAIGRQKLVRGEWGNWLRQPAIHAFSRKAIGLLRPICEPRPPPAPRIAQHRPS